MDNKILDSTGPKFTLDDVIKFGKYCYEYHQTTSFPDQSFEDNCLNNLKQFIISENK